MNQFNLAGSLTKSASVFASAKSQSPTYQGYSRFMKVATPQHVDPFQKPPHMQNPEYLIAHAAKADINDKSIALNDLEEGVKLTILSLS